MNLRRTCHINTDENYACITLTLPFMIRSLYSHLDQKRPTYVTHHLRFATIIIDKDMIIMTLSSIPCCRKQRHAQLYAKRCIWITICLCLHIHMDYNIDPIR